MRRSDVLPRRRKHKREPMVAIESLEPRRLMSGIVHSVGLLPSNIAGLADTLQGDGDVFFVRNGDGYTPASSSVGVFNLHRQRWYSFTFPDFTPDDASNYAIAGNDLIYNDGDINAYNLQTGALSQVDIPNSYSGAFVTVGDKALVAGGGNTATGVFYPVDNVEILDTSTGQSSTTTLSQAEIPNVDVVDHTALFIGANYTLFGQSMVDSNALDVYNADTNTWSNFTLQGSINTFSTANLDHEAVFAGGYLGQEDDPYYAFAHPSAQAYVYNDQTGTLTEHTLSLGRIGATSAVVDNLALFAGGSYFNKPNGINYPEANVDIYNAITGQWSTASLSMPRNAPASYVAGNTALFIGGISYKHAYPTTVDLFNAATGQWSTKILVTVGNNFTAVVAGSDAVFYDSVVDTKQRDPIVQVYNGSTGQWSNITAPYDIDGDANETVGNDIFFYDNSGKSSRIVIFNTAALTWSATFLTSPRAGPAAVVAGNQLFFVGGEHDNTASNAVDIFTLPSGGVSSASRNVSMWPDSAAVQSSWLKSDGEVL